MVQEIDLEKIIKNSSLFEVGVCERVGKKYVLHSGRCK